MGYSKKRIVLDMGKVVKNEGRIEGVGVDKNTKNQYGQYENQVILIEAFNGFSHLISITQEK